MNKNILDNQFAQEEKSNLINPRFGVIALMIILAAASRFLPHPPNFTPIGGMALFGAAFFAKKYWAYIIPFLALWASDLILNNVVYAAYHEGFVLMPTYALWTYLAFGLMILMGSKLLKKITIPNVLIGAVSASMIFFLVTNFGAWYADPFHMFADDASGLVAALAAGLPYFWNTLAGDLVYASILFGSFALIKNTYPTLTLSRT